jgi:CHAT domain-containing protein/tetratricopeptide (TPR) repeat protein
VPVIDESHKSVADSGPVALDALLGLAIARPVEALAEARTLLASRPGTYAASAAHQAVGIVLRDRGEMAAALAELRRARRLAAASADTRREADVRATLGATLVLAGRGREGLTQLDWAVERSSGAAAGRVLHRRAAAYYALGRYDAASDDLTRAVPLLRRASDEVWEARALNLRADVHLALGRIPLAAADIAAAERMAAAAGNERELAVARHNLGLVAAASGDLPRALAHLDEARARFESIGDVRADQILDRCAVLLAAGLAQEAFAEADEAARAAGGGAGQGIGGGAGPGAGGGAAGAAGRAAERATKPAELLLMAATAALAGGRAGEARARAAAARALFAAQRRDWWVARAEFVAVQARHAEGERGMRLLTQAQKVAQRLDALGSDDATRAHLLVGRLALDRGRPDLAEPHLERAAAARRAGPPLGRSVGWLAQALRAEARGDARGTALACARGLDALDEHRLTLGATELRAYATAHGGELAAVAQRGALRRGDACALLAWSERRRAPFLGRGSAAVPPQCPGDEGDLVAELAALRTASQRLVAARAEGEGTALLERERRRLEAAVRARTRSAVGTGESAGERFRLADLRTELGAHTTLVELVEVGGTLHALVVDRRGVRHHVVGVVSDAVREVEMARFTLRRLASGRGARHADAMLASAGRLLQDVLLGPAAGDLGTGAVVLVPPGRLHSVPWALLPALRERVVSVAPSAAMWVRARRATPPSRRRVALVVGPGLSSGAAEVPALAAAYPAATVWRDGTATAENVLAALDGAWLGHIAAHGTFRADNPLFSALRLDDGPLIVHDFERLRRAPYRLVLSACDSGVAASVGAEEPLGLAAALVSLGSAGVLASVVPVNDASTVPLMLALHEELRAGADLAQALAGARAALAADGDAVGAATAASFVALGN